MLKRKQFFFVLEAQICPRGRQNTVDQEHREIEVDLRILRRGQSAIEFIPEENGSTIRWVERHICVCLSWHDLGFIAEDSDRYNRYTVKAGLVNRIMYWLLIPQHARSWIRCIAGVLTRPRAVGTRLETDTCRPEAGVVQRPARRQVNYEFAQVICGAEAASDCI